MRLTSYTFFSGSSTASRRAQQQNIQTRTRSVSTADIKEHHQMLLSREGWPASIRDSNCLIADSSSGELPIVWFHLPSNREIAPPQKKKCSQTECSTTNSASSRSDPSSSFSPKLQILLTDPLEARTIESLSECIGTQKRKGSRRERESEVWPELCHCWQSLSWLQAEST